MELRAGRRPAGRLRESIRIAGQNERFLACLDARGVGREVGPNLGPNYAPARFAEMTEAKGATKQELARSMERLFHIGAIEAVEMPRKGRETKTIIVRSEPSEPASERLPNGPSEPVRTSFRTVPRTDPITKVISGAATEAAAPIEEEACSACSGVGCNFCP